MQKLVKNAYEMNSNTLLERTKIVDGLWIGASIAAVIFFVVLAASRGILILRLKKMMRAKKLI